MNGQGDGIPRPYGPYRSEPTEYTAWHGSFPVAELPRSTWQPFQPVAPRQILTPGPQRRKNSPATVASVLSLVLGLVLSVALLGRDDLFGGVVLVEGFAVAGPAQPASGGAPRAPATSTTPKPRPVLQLEDNPLHADGMSLPAVDCQLPTLARDPEQLRAYYQGAIACLDNAWRPVLERANEPFSTPRLEIEAGPSRCGEPPSKDEATAYYCSGDKVIFMPRDRLLEQAGLSQGAHLAVLAHEYGHHVQALSGILAAAYDRGEQFDKTSPEKLELTRRAELQANCFAGMFIASVGGRGTISAKVARAAVDSFRDTIGDDTHGTVKHQVRWGKQGYDTNNAAACNTWTAPPEEVS